jgi:hypothetical protein
LARSTLPQRRTDLIEDVIRRLNADEARVMRELGNIDRAARLLEAADVRRGDAIRFPMSRSQIASVGAMALADVGELDAAGEYLLRWSLEDAVESTSPLAVVAFTTRSTFELMAGDHEYAERILDEAPTVGPLRGDARWGDYYPHAVEFQRAAIDLARGRASQALRRIRGKPRFELDDQRSPIAQLHGEVECAAGSAADGLALLERQIALWPVAVDGVAHPGRARLLSAAGLCALKLNRRQQATQWALQARNAFALQPRTSDWYKAPLVQLTSDLGRP